MLEAQSPYELHRLLNKYAEISQWGNNLPLTKWASTWELYKKTSVKDVINELSIACYANNHPPKEQSRLNRKIHDSIKT